MRKTSPVIGGSPTKITHKNASKAADKGRASPGAGSLVSDIGIIKKESGGKRSSASGSAGLGENAFNNSTSLI